MHKPEKNIWGHSLCFTVRALLAVNSFRYGGWSDSHCDSQTQPVKRSDDFFVLLKVNEALQTGYCQRIDSVIPSSQAAQGGAQ